MNTSTLSYGTDPSGLICGYLIDPATGGHALECEDAARWLDARARVQEGAKATADASFLWLHFNLAHIGALRRLLVRLQRLLAPEPAALFRLLQHPPPWMTELDVQELRQASEEFSVVLSDMSTLQERIKLLQEEIAAQVNEGNNRSLFVLTIVTVLALPINIIAGLLGMNVGGVPLAQNAHGFWIVVAIVAAFTTIAGWFALLKQRDR